jgi:hypothetical protein
MGKIWVYPEKNKNLNKYIIQGTVKKKINPSGRKMIRETGMHQASSMIMAAASF